MTSTDNYEAEQAAEFFAGHGTRARNLGGVKLYRDLTTGTYEDQAGTVAINKDSFTYFAYYRVWVRDDKSGLTAAQRTRISFAAACELAEQLLAAK